MNNTIAHSPKRSLLHCGILVNSIWFICLPCSLGLVATTNGSEEEAVHVAALSGDVEPTASRAIASPQPNVALNIAPNGVSNGLPTANEQVDGRIFEEVDQAIVKDKFTRLIADTKTATWNTKVCEHLGDKSEESTVKVAWAGVDLQRVKVLTGRAAGKTLLLRGDVVHVGWLKFSHTNRMVQTLRGHSLKMNGFLDDIQHMLKNWDDVTVTDDAGLWLIHYTAPMNHLKAKMWMDPVTLHVSKTVTVDDAGQLAGCYEYDSIVYNPKLPAKTWKR